ncbi:MAG: TRAP transporter large permease [Christensenellales bacterium]|jgi:C4-dicarboxylate transporter DctM subunit
MTASSALLLFIVAFMGLAILLKMPVSYALGTASLLVFAASKMNTVTLAQVSFSALDSFAFLAIPFYIYAGTLMEHVGISRMLISWIQSFVGRIRGALGIICVLACMAFGVLTGSAMATISAIGKIMAPEMIKENYPRPYISAMLAATSFLGILIPPSVPGIMYALSSGLKISEVWMVTVGPAFIFAFGYFIVNYFRVGRFETKKERERVALSKRIKDKGIHTIRAFPALLMPLIIYGSIYGGICTPTEAGALSAVYGIIYYIVLWFVKREKITMSFSKIAAVSGASTAVIGLLNVYSGVAGKAITLAGVSNYLSSLIISNIESRTLFLILINVLFLFMGTFMDINATILIMTPLLLPVALHFNVTAIHFGAILLINMCVGFLTPPFAAGIFVSTKIAGASFSETVKESLPFLAVGLVAIVITTCFPGFLMFFVNLLN